MPRGTGKSTLCERGDLAAVRGYRRFIVIIGAESNATDVSARQSSFESNELHCGLSVLVRFKRLTHCQQVQGPDPREENAIE